jgi:excisionase family DNA binding protein
MQRPYLAQDIAVLTGRSTDTVYRWVRKGCIPHRRLQGTSLIFPREEIDAWLNGKPGTVINKVEGAK